MKAFERETKFSVVVFDSCEAITKEAVAGCFSSIEREDLKVEYIFGGKNILTGFIKNIGSFFKVEVSTLWNSKVIIQNTLPDNYALLTAGSHLCFMPHMLLTEFEDLPLLIGRYPENIKAYSEKVYSKHVWIFNVSVKEILVNVYGEMIKEMLSLGNKKEGIEKYISNFISETCIEKNKYGYHINFHV